MDPILVNNQRCAELSVLHVLFQTLSSVGDEGRNFTLDWQVICILQAAEESNIRRVSYILPREQMGPRDLAGAGMGVSTDWGTSGCWPTQTPPVQSWPGLVKPRVLPPMELRAKVRYQQ